jgi:acyl-coenzyme A thioesterase PaaI-like protein
MASARMFLNAIRRDLPAPPTARTLRFDLPDIGPDDDGIAVAFEGTETFTDPFGEELSGFLAAMLDHTGGQALLATLSAGTPGAPRGPEAP